MAVSSDRVVGVRRIITVLCGEGRERRYRSSPSDSENVDTGCNEAAEIVGLNPKHHTPDDRASRVAHLISRTRCGVVNISRVVGESVPSDHAVVITETAVESGAHFSIRAGVDARQSCAALHPPISAQWKKSGNERLKGAPATMRL